MSMHRPDGGEALRLHLGDAADTQGKEHIYDLIARARQSPEHRMVLRQRTLKE